MSTPGLIRIQYWNVIGPNSTPRTGLTSRAESRTDVEGYLLASDAARTTALHDWGIAAGLRVIAAAGFAGVTVAQGTTLDVDGHVVVLGEGGLAITDPQVGRTGVQNIPTVPVGPEGVVLDTSTVQPGQYLLTITWREVEEAAAGLLVLRQAPWLRLVDAGPFDEDGRQLVLAAVDLAAGGVVQDLQPGQRRLAGVVTGLLTLSVPGADPESALSAGQRRSAEFAPRDDGGVDLRLVKPGGAVRRALAVAGDTGDLQLDGALRVTGPVALTAGLAVGGSVEVTGDIGTTGNLTAGGDLAVSGAVTVDDDLQVTGGVVAGGTAKLGTLAVRGATTIGVDGHAANLDVSNDVFVAHRLGVRTRAPHFEVDVAGTVCAATFCNPSDARLKTGVTDLVGVLDRLAEVRAVSFVPVDGEAGTVSGRRAGVVAQQMERAFPELVVPMGTANLLAVDYAGLAGVLVGAVNELRTAHRALADRLDEIDRRSDGDDDRQ